MAEQSYANHAHRPRLAAVAFIFLLTALICFVGYGFGWFISLQPGLLALCASVLCLVLISRAYIVALQDRIILLEMKVRCAEVLPAGQDARLTRLSKAQVIALRFASDEELGALLERAEREKLSARDIKQAIRNWRPDPFRT